MNKNIASNRLSEQIIRKSPKGISCSFVKLDDDWGVKCFSRKAHRDESFKWQSRAAKVGLAPKVGEQFTFGNYFCYITQVAELPIECDKIDGMDWDDYDALCSEYEDEIEKLQAELNEKIHWWFGDDHIGNIGFIEGKMVCIDFCSG